MEFENVIIAKIESLLDYQPGRNREDLDIQYEYQINEDGIVHIEMEINSIRDIELWLLYADFAINGIEPLRPFPDDTLLKGCEKNFDEFKNGNDYMFRLRKPGI
jgi:hypothetical protein